MKRIIFFIFVFVISISATSSAGEFKISSPAFDHMRYIPKKFSCQESDLYSDVNPKLIIDGIPKGTKSFALIVDDPDAPMGTWIHWVLFDIPVVDVIEESSEIGKSGVNDYGGSRYDGPCPPWGTHRYFFKLYALDTMFNLAPRATRNQPDRNITKEKLLNTMEGHILGQATLVGLYKKHK